MTDAENLEIKKRARRRLVGAPPRALLAAIVLPMMMDQEPGPSVQDIQVSIPDREADSTLARPIAAREAPTAEPQVAPPPEEQAPSPAQAAPASGVAEAKGEAKAEARAVPQVDDKARAAAAEAEAARVRAILDGQAPSAPAESFVVQVAAFGDGSRADKIATELKKAGLAAYTEKAGNLTRVRVGPFAAREAAEKVASRLQSDGYKPVVSSR